MSDLHEPPPPTDLTQIPIKEPEELDNAGMRGGSSAKIDQLVHLLRLTPPTEKSLVFSQFTSFLDKVRRLVPFVTCWLTWSRYPKHWRKKGLHNSQIFILLANIDHKDFACAI